MLSTEGTVQAQIAPQGPPPICTSGHHQSPSPHVPLWVPGVTKWTARKGRQYSHCAIFPHYALGPGVPFCWFTPHLQCGQVCDLVSQGPNPVIAPIHLQPRLQLNQLLIPASMVPGSQKGDLGLLADIKGVCLLINPDQMEFLFAQLRFSEVETYLLTQETGSFSVT